jgi:NADPH-dependent 2,4-dienoyl-CoA reductase/sulfur reductase-like enzyme
MVPNVRATVQEIHEGLTVASQNRVGPLDRDLMAVNDLFWPFLGAGFYYKTFMWPRAFWEGLYEPLIRRAAGLGRMTKGANPELNERAFAHCDLLVIGGGPAGLIAAQTAAEAGADVILIDENTALGGRLLSDSEEIGGKPGDVWAAEMQGKLAAMDNVRIMTRTTVTGVYDGPQFRRAGTGGTAPAPRPDLPRECFWRIGRRPRFWPPARWSGPSPSR